MILYVDQEKYIYELSTLTAMLPHYTEKIQILPLAEKPLNEDVYICFVEDSDNSNQVQMISVEGHRHEVKFDALKAGEETLKNSYKRLLYRFLEQQYGFHSDWGILTGIRPSKFYSQMRGILQSDQQVQAHFIENLFLSSEKASVLSCVDHAQKSALSSVSRDSFSVYISVPFCPSRCNYCTFFSNRVDQKKHLIPSYIRSLESELERALKSEWAKSRSIDTLYIGGGTPSSLDNSDLGMMLRMLDRYLNLSKIKEVTFEAGRPDTITQDKLRLIHSFGINRISINPQSMNDHTLERIGRQHSSSQIKEAYRAARSVDFQNINMDIILGLEDESLEDLQNTLDELMEMQPDSITMHSLALKKASDLSKIYDRTVLSDQNENVRSMANACYQKLNAAGYKPYYLYRQKNILGGQENVGFARPNRHSIYNMVIIEEYQHILAFGPGAVSRFVYPDENRIERVANTKNLEEYIRNTDVYTNKKLEMMK